jgi:Cu2+-exporting ATPase
MKDGHQNHIHRQEHNTNSPSDCSNEHHSHHKKNLGENSHQHNVSADHNHNEHNHSSHHGHMIEDFKKRFWISLLLTIPIIIISPMIHHILGIGDTLKFDGNMLILFVLSSIVYFYGGWPFLKGLADELKAHKPGMMTLIAFAISVAYFYSSALVFGVEGDDFFWELATLIDIMLLGHWIEMKSVMGTSKALEELAKLLPDTAHKINDDGQIIEVKVSTISGNDRLLIKPGEKIPADGKIFEGKTSINEAMITGESKPVSKSGGDDVIGGSINGEGSIKIEVKKTGDQSFLSQVVKLVREAQESKSKTQDLANKAAFWLTIIAIISGTITLVYWLFVESAGLSFALSRTVTVLVITCPHALGLAIPLVVSVSTAISAKNGLLIRNRTAFEQARNLQAIVFDKTGTLTKGEFGVTDKISYNSEYDEMEVLKYAASVESESEHPIAKSIVSSSKEKYSVKEFQAIPGKGAAGNVNGKSVSVVSPGYLKENNIKIESQQLIEKLSEQGKTVVFVLIDNRLTGAIALADMIREESKEAVKQLKRIGIKPIMLTGDNKKVAEWVARELDIDEYFAEVLPDKKSDKIKEIQNRGLTVAMVGDGVNDAPALAQADVGIAIGAGTDVAVETADIILVKNNPKDIVSLVQFAKSTYRKMIQNLFWATGYNIISIPLAAGILAGSGIILSPEIGAILMSISTIVVAINAKTLRL